MKWGVILIVIAAAACSPKPLREFPVGLLAPVSLRVAVEAHRLGLEIAPQAPLGAAEVSAAFPVKKGDEVVADSARLRFSIARAVVEGSSGVFLRLPRTPAGRDLLEYVEEWQAVERAAREILAMRPIIQGGTAASTPFVVPAGIELRAWAFRGRRYVLLVNSSEAPLPLQQEGIASWRALFTVRSDARQVLTPCAADLCLPPGGVLWLEGRLLPNIFP